MSFSVSSSAPDEGDWSAKGGRITTQQTTTSKKGWKKRAGQQLPFRHIRGMFSAPSRSYKLYVVSTSAGAYNSAAGLERVPAMSLNQSCSFRMAGFRALTSVQGRYSGRGQLAPFRMASEKDQQLKPREIGAIAIACTAFSNVGNGRRFQQYGPHLSRKRKEWKKRAQVCNARRPITRNYDGRKSRCVRCSRAR